VHWSFHKFTLSLDAVVKYFACGFLLVTAMLLVVESLVSSVAMPITIIIIFLAISLFAPDRAKEYLDKYNELMKGLDQGNQNYEMCELTRSIISENKVFVSFALFLFVFVNAFIVAALVEELGKYYGYWMVEHPDVLLDNEMEHIQNRNEGVSSKDVSANSEEEMTTLSPRKTLNTVGASVTVGKKLFLYFCSLIDSVELTNNQFFDITCRNGFCGHRDGLL